jgi:hypothetical protein
MADTAPLSKVDSVTNEPEFKKATAEEVKKGHRRASSMAADVYAIEDLGECSCWQLPVRGREGQVGLTDNRERKERH